MKKIKFTENYIVLICAFRYALGRSTYITSDISLEIINNWDAIPIGGKRLIHKEIKEAIELDHAGMQCDIDSWKSILKLKI